ncbi:MAG: hypothetical protein QGG73_13985, partial [Candidatus Hydrogenedentes bacterium]|nr:hypothetical protein [Candidatus Hydrogenedentota bacterium]
EGAGTGVEIDLREPAAARHQDRFWASVQTVAAGRADVDKPTLRQDSGRTQRCLGTAKPAPQEIGPR